MGLSDSCDNYSTGMPCHRDPEGYGYSGYVANTRDTEGPRTGRD